MSRESVPFLDLASLHRELESDILGALSPLLRNAAFVGGEPVAAFETAFAAQLGARRVVTVKSGTSALRLALAALGVEPGDRVVVPAFTFVATASAVLHAGAIPVFADVEEETATLDPEAAAAALGPGVRAILPVHLYGHPAAMGPLAELAAAHGLRILEDCAQSHLATLEGRTTGTLGAAGAFSFYPTKNLGAAGDAGCVATDDDAVADRVRAAANHGRSDPMTHLTPGYNERLDAFQAAILGVKLPHLAGWTAERQRAAARYRELLSGAAPWGEPLRLPVERPGARHVYHLFVVRHARRDAIREALAREGIGTAVHYPRTVPGQPAFAGMDAGHFPRAEAWAASCLALPLYPGIPVAHQERVAEAIHQLPG